MDYCLKHFNSFYVAKTKSRFEEEKLSLKSTTDFESTYWKRYVPDNGKNNIFELHCLITYIEKFGKWTYLELWIPMTENLDVCFDLKRLEFGSFSNSPAVLGITFVIRLDSSVPFMVIFWKKMFKTSVSPSSYSNTSKSVS